MANIDYITDYKDEVGAELAANASIRQLDIIGPIVANTHAIKRPLLAASYITKVSKKRPSRIRSQCILGALHHMETQTWVELIIELGILNWEFRTHASGNTYWAESFAFICAEEKPGTLALLLEHYRDTRPNISHQQLERTLLASYRSASYHADESILTSHPLHCDITALEKIGARLPADAPFVFSFSTLPGNSNVFANQDNQHAIALGHFLSGTHAIFRSFMKRNSHLQVPLCRVIQKHVFNKAHSMLDDMDVVRDKELTQTIHTDLIETIDYLIKKRV
ncbi:hypothetical protein AB4571_03955 [Vibrio breoganii]|uniref:hypothetical protein n=1 Tax=Vibrio breoganii TaxID=553239 RepID=UPI000C85061B|nr:hypothetical protein [Vibrio breoganii]PML10945.1 hypothetical protein BCT84_03530 [Vibrio breoganii]